MPVVMVALRTTRVRLGDTVHRVSRGRTTAHADHPIVAAAPDLWRPLPIDYPVSEDPVNDPPETVADPPETPPTAEDAGSSTTDANTEPASEGVTTESVASVVTPGEPSAKEVRAWAKDQGLDVPARGKLPDELYERYKAAHGD